MNNDVIKTIFFYDNSQGNKTIENHDGEILERSKEEVLNEIQNKIRNHIFLSYTVIRDQQLVTYQLNQEEGAVNLRMGLFDESLPALRTILSAIPRKVLEDSNKKSTIKITISEESCHVSYFLNQNVSSKELQEPKEVIDYIQCLKNNNEIISAIRDGNENLRYVFETSEQEEFKIYVRVENKKVVEALDSLVSAKIKKKNKKKWPILTGMVLCGGLAMLFSKNPKVRETVQSIHEKSMEQNETTALLDKNFYRIKSLYSRFKTSELSEEEKLELNNRLEEVLTYLHAIDSKDECVGILERYADDICPSLSIESTGTRKK